MRTPDFPVGEQFTARWSIRAFDANHKLSETELKTVLEAARWAPSCANEQPWIFYHEKDTGSRDRFLTFLTDANQYWARSASHIVIVCARKTFAASGKSNLHARYDAGAAWMAMALQAAKMGYAAHCMAGIHTSVIAESLGIDETNTDIITAVAIGKLGDASHLSEKHRAQEAPNGRKPLSEYTFAV
jgi:nitroreductase